MRNLCLQVAFDDYTTRDNKWVLDPAWRVQVYCVGSRFEHESYPWQHVPGAKFGRKLDAEIALRSLLEAGLDTADKIGDLLADVPRIMCENLQW